MNELLKSLYDNYYEELPLTDLKAEVDRCHKLLIERPEKPERRLVLQIIDSQDAIADRLSMDSLFADFHLAWELNHELNMYSRALWNRQKDSTALSLYQPEQKEEIENEEK